MSMFGSEIKKVFTGKFILVLLSLCVLNVLLIYYNEIRTTPYHGEGGYKETWEQIEKELETSDILTVYEREKQEADENIFSGLIKAAAVKKQIVNELEGIIGYTDYLRNMRETAELTGSISIFRDNESGYSVRNREKTIRVYEKMESVTVQPSPSLGIALFSASTLTDFMVLILIVYAVFSIWIKDQEEGMQNLLRSCYRGRKSLAAVKAAAGVFVCLVIELLLYGGTLFISWKLYGLGNLTRFLPSVSMFRQTAWPVRVWEFLILFLIVKLLAYSMCMLLFGFFAGKVHTSTATILVSGIVIGGSCLTYGQISGDSYAGIFKYLLPYGLLQTQEVFRIYRNLNLFEYPVNLAAAYGVVLVFGIAVLVFFLLRGADQKKSRVLRHNVSVLKWRRTKSGLHRLDECGGVLLNELRKLLIDRKVFLILVVLGLLQGYLYKGETVRYYNYTEYCYRQYLDVLSGELTPEKEAYMENEKERFAELLNGQDQTAAGPGSDMEKQLQAYEAFCRVLDYCDYLRENHLTYMVYEPAYEELTASAGNGKDAFLAFEMMAFMVLCATQIYGPDDQLHMSRLCRMTLYGRKRAELIRVGISACIGVVILCLSYLPFLLNVVETYQISAEEFFYPAGCLRSLNAHGVPMTIGGYLLLLSALRFLFLNFGGFIVCFLSEKLKSVMNTVMLGFLLLALPFGVLMLAEAAAPFLVLYSPLLGNYLMKLPLFATVGIPAFILIVMWGMLCRK
ncbi:MAG: hypothetical protein HDQ98_16710 [Lachnospiraceae bacterium]|nr:hypothetical protein [Lachnospiraceae bacterium]